MACILLLGIAILFVGDEKVSGRKKRIFYIIFGVVTLLFLQNRAADFLKQPSYRHMTGLRTFVSYAGYTLRPYLQWLVWEEITGGDSHWERRIMIGLCVLNQLIFSLCFFTKLVCWYRDDYVWVRGPLGLTAHFVFAVMLLMYLVSMIRIYRRGERMSFICLSICLVLLIAAVLYDTILDRPATLPEAAAYCIVLYFFVDYVQTEKGYRIRQAKMMRAEMMMLQIKPHFINNTLGTIQALCEIDPEAASKAIGDFARYLRVNLYAADDPYPIPAEDEIKHTKTYVEIEKLRYPKIEVEFDVEDTDFSIPALTIQPLVENAIVHGIRGMENGKVTLSTRLTKEGHRIRITDNGNGIDSEHKNRSGLKEGHGVGMENVRFRLEHVMHGRMTVESQKGKGTSVTILIPSEDQL